MPIPLQVNPIQLNPINNGGGISAVGGSPTPQPAPTPQASGLPQVIQQARQQGVPDEQIYNYLHQQGMIPTNAVVTQGKQPEGAALHDTGSFLGNLGNSAWEFAKGIGSAAVNVFNPNMEKNTVMNVGKVASGLIQEPFVLAHNVLTGTKPGEEGGWEIKSKPYEALINSLGERYGSWENVKKTAYQDPIGFLADAASVLDAGAGAVGKLGEVSKVAEVSKAANVLGKAGEIINPLNIAGKATDFVGDLSRVGLKNVSDYLEKSNLRMTPVQKTNFEKYIPDVVDYIDNNIPVGGPVSRHESAVANINKIEDTLQEWFDTETSGLSVKKQDLLDATENLKQQFSKERDALAIDKQIDEFKNTIEAKYGDEISASDLNRLKRSTFKNAFNNAGTKISDIVEYKIGDMLYDGLKTLTENNPVMGKYPLEQYNRAYQVAIKAEQLLKTAIGRPQVGFLEKLLMDSIGFGTSGPMGALGAHAAANYLPVTATKAAVAKGLRATSNLPKVKIPNGGTAGINTVSRLNNYANQKDEKKVKVRKP